MTTNQLETPINSDMLPKSTTDGTQRHHGYVITLVHGTRARKAQWTAQNSSLCKWLEKELGGSAILHAFEWSGRNSHQHRLNAATELADSIRRQTLQYPLRQHFVIGHSHGGTVAAYALRDEGVCKLVRGVACLSTPFLHVRRRALGKLGADLLFIADFLFWMGLFFAATFVVSLYVPGFEEIRTGEKSLANFIRYFVLGIVLGFPLYALKTRLDARWRRQRERYWSGFGLEHLAGRNLLIIRSGADEASGALVAAQFLNWLWTRLWLGIEKPIAKLKTWSDAWGDRLAPFARIFFLVMFFGGPFLSVALAAGLIPEVLMYALSGIVALFFVLGLPVFVQVLIAPVLSIAFVLICIPIGLLLLPFGGELVLMTPVMDVTSESTPPGSWQVHHLRNLDSQRDGLMHSSAYSSTEAFELLTRWISGSANAVSTRR